MRTVFAAATLAAALALTASAAQAQLPPMNLLRDKPPPSADEVKRQKAIDKAYKDTLDQMPSKKSDPWGNIRGADQKQSETRN